MNIATPGRWAGLWRQVAQAESAEAVYNHLVARYSEPHRHYHTLRHIAECLSEFDSVRHLARSPLAVELAIWFHDAVYDTRAQDNEERSAELAERHLRDAGAGADLCKSVVALVMVTKTHYPAQVPDASLLVDIDLSILGRAPERFQEFEAQVRREYEWVPEQTFAARRAEILRGFLDRERIYGTDEFHARYERQARLNLQNSIHSLVAQI